MKKNNDIKQDELTAQYKVSIKFASRYNKCKRLLFVLLIIVLFESIYILHKDSDHDFRYTLSGESENFIYTNAMFIKSGNRYDFIHGRWDTTDTTIKESDIKSVTLMCGDRLIVGSSDFLYGSITETKGYDEYFPKEVVENMDKWYFEIKYMKNDEELVDIIELR